jgi:hypothetical protein
MPAPIRNTFYNLLLVACGLLLVTMFTWLLGWAYVPNPDGERLVQGPKPPMVKWVERHALTLLISEVAAVFLLGVLTIALDPWLDPVRRNEPEPSDPPPPPPNG